MDNKINIGIGIAVAVLILLIAFGGGNTKLSGSNYPIEYETQNLTHSTGTVGVLRTNPLATSTRWDFAIITNPGPSRLYYWFGTDSAAGSYATSNPGAYLDPGEKLEFYQDKYVLNGGMWWIASTTQPAASTTVDFLYHSK